MSKKNEVIERKKNEVSASVPDFMKGDVGKGTESLGAEDVEIPRLQVLQALSPQVTDGDEKPGQFFHTIMEESLGNTLRAVIVHTSIQYILWRPRHEGGGILARSIDGVTWSPANAEFKVKPSKDSKEEVIWRTKPTVAESGLDKFGSGNPNDPSSQPAATKMWNFVIMLPDHPEYGPMVLTMQRGMASVGRNLSSKLKLTDVPSFGQVFKLAVKKESSSDGDFFSISAVKEGLVSDEAEYVKYKAMYERFRDMGVQIKDIEGMQSEESGDAGKAPKGAIDV